MSLTNDAKAVDALTTRLGARKRPSLTAKMWHRFAVVLGDSEPRPADVLGQAFDPGAVPGVDSELAARVDALLGGGASATLEADELRQKGTWTFTIVDDGYPDALVARLGDQTRL